MPGGSIFVIGPPTSEGQWPLRKELKKKTADEYGERGRTLDRGWAQ